MYVCASIIGGLKLAPPKQRKSSSSNSNDDDDWIDDIFGKDDGFRAFARIIKDMDEGREPSDADMMKILDSRNQARFQQEIAERTIRTKAIADARGIDLKETPEDKQTLAEAEEEIGLRRKLQIQKEVAAATTTSSFNNYVEKKRDAIEGKEPPEGDSIPVLFPDNKQKMPYVGAPITERPVAAAAPERREKLFDALRTSIR